MTQPLPNTSPSLNEAGLSLVETLISTVIALLMGVAMFSGIAAYFKDGQVLDEMGDHANNATQMRMVTPLLLDQASYVGTPTTATVSSPWLIPNPYASGSYEGVNIQWIPYAASGGVSLCTGTLVDHTSYLQNGGPGQSEPINGIEWNVTASVISGVTQTQANQACGVGRAYFPANNQWGFYGPVQEPGCPGHQQALIISNIYQYHLTASDYSTASEEGMIACLPNVH